MLEYALLVVGLVLLVQGAEFLVEGAKSLAKLLNIPTLVIGLTVVSFGTSMPELMVNLLSVYGHAPEVALGNVIGSNISNILLVLGITALMGRVAMQHSTVWNEMPFAILAGILLLLVAFEPIGGAAPYEIGRVEGIIFLLFFVGFMIYVAHMAKNNNLKDRKLTIRDRNPWQMAFFILVGMLGLYLGGKWTVEGAVAIASIFGISEFLISATIIAVGTSLPELATSVAAAVKKDMDIAVGNIVGSNIFNILWILGLTAAISPVSVSSFIIMDILIMLGVTLLLFFLMFMGKKHSIGRRTGFVFVAMYAAYIIFLVVRG